MNKAIIIGRLTRDPEVRYSQGQNSQCVARFSVAVDRKFKKEGEPEADFFNCTSFGKQAEFVEKYLKKGTKVVVTGRMQNDNYTTKDGQKVYSVKIMVEELEFAESKGGSSREERDAAALAAAGYSPSSTGDGFMNIPDGIDEELPFN